MIVQQILAPIRHHATLHPLARDAANPVQIVADLVRNMRGADRFVARHVAETLDILRPRLYDLWDAAASVQDAPAWLAPLAKYGEILRDPETEGEHGVYRSDVRWGVQARVARLNALLDEIHPERKAGSP